MDPILECVKNYISRENTDYAIMITGPWGCGKTFYWKNTIEKEIKKLKIPIEILKDEKENNSLLWNILKKIYLDNKNLFLINIEDDDSCRPVYVSLYGIDKLENISKEVIIAALPDPMRSKPAILLGKIIQTILKKISGEVFQTLTPEFLLKYYNLRNCVLCFDDLERTKLNIQDVLGYINTFVEHNYIKTIIIANEDEIVQQKDNNDKDKIGYSKIKEKLIGKTIKFNKDIIELFDHIVENNGFSDDLKTFLKNNKSFVIEVVESGNPSNNLVNLRILKNALYDFKEIFIYMKNKNEKIIKDYLCKMLLSILSIAFEIKSGSRTIEEFKKYNPLTFPIFAGAGDDIKKSYQDFITKYFSNYKDKFIYQESIIELMVYGLFNKTKFEEEINSILFIKEDKIEPRYSYLRKLVGDTLSLEFNEFIEAVTNVLKAVREGQYKFTEYLNIHDRFLAIDEIGILPEALSNFTGDFETGIKLAKERDEYNEYVPPRDVILSKNEKRQIEYLLLMKKLNSELKIKKDKMLGEKYLDKFENNFQDFCQELGINLDRTFISNKPIFDKIPTSDFIEILKCKNNFELRTFNRAMYSRYRSIRGSEEIFMDEYNNLHSLNEEIKKLKLDTQDLIKKKNINGLSELLSGVLIEMEKVKNPNEVESGENK